MNNHYLKLAIVLMVVGAATLAATRVSGVVVRKVGL